ncbi:MAG: hypothetical protein HON62_12375, partial [Rhodospirillaceae bacterium]|nr:hypothetical protein [Rhodospirillaceae bacterium]
SGSGSADVTFNDYLDGGAGSDYVYGGRGDDTGVWTLSENIGETDAYDGDGDDTITDFTAGVGSDDRLDISEFGFTDLADLLAATNDAGADTVITLDADDSVTLIGVQKADLHEDDFLL